MDIKKGRISNINKKLITGALAFTLVSACFVTGTISYAKELERQRYENFVGVASFDRLSNCYFIEILNSNENTSEFYITEKIEIFSNEVKIGYLYFNILDGTKVFSYINEVYEKPGKKENINKEIVREVSVKNYLHYPWNYKKMYNSDDINSLLENIKDKNVKKNKK